ncbi:hypothetical protein MSAN_01267900 [Mycena sanguinolenta]|uniref:Carbohydrate-binding module family 67 protein n=1 Tax=Mycena sanguinolenta TaxID=230812 RepID=A0A8H6YJ56_9AGAR|nr:hypothetical protein MSAN_01267900 [Mycena sanguinolenta]
MVPQLISSLLAFTALCLVPGVAALDFSTSQWIWTNEISGGSGGNAPVGARAFRKDFTPPLGKTPVEANILITVDNGFTLYVNGGEIGTGGDFRYAESFCVALRPCLNVFAVTGVNTAGPAGLLATIQITYDDGSTSTIVSDTTWRASTTVPAGYEQLSFDANSWTPAIAQGGYGVSPWGQIAIPSTPPVLSLTNANWIWTNEVVNGNAPPGSRAFRRIYTPPTGQTATSATIIMVADNGYSLYVNGVPVGAGTDFHVAQKYTVNLAPAPNVLFAVKATNADVVNNPAGLLAAIEITMADCNCTSGAFLLTDGSWKSNTGTPVGFELPGFNDSSWPAATVEGAYGMSPWGTVTVTDVPGPISAISGGSAVNSTATAA